MRRLPNTPFDGQLFKALLALTTLMAVAVVALFAFAIQTSHQPNSAADLPSVLDHPTAAVAVWFEDGCSPAQVMSEYGIGAAQMKIIDHDKAICEVRADQAQDLLRHLRNDPDVKDAGFLIVNKNADETLSLPPMATP